jgi:uncharacterized membrane protein YhaH (DUF805 family)
MQEFIAAIKRYSDFSGRSTRKEYWLFVLLNFIFSMATGLLDSFLGTEIVNEPTVFNGVQFENKLGLLNALYSLFILVPSLAVAVRRLHDVGKSGWMLLIALVPCLGWVWLIILLVEDSQEGENKWGPNPKEQDLWGGSSFNP